MRLVFALAFAVLIAGAGSPKPASPPEGMDQEELNSLKERCNIKRPTRDGPVIWRKVVGEANCSLNVCRQSCSKAELELVAEAFPKWHKKYTKAVRKCLDRCYKRYREGKKPVLWVE